MTAFPYFKQFDSMDCGPTCLQMVAKHYGKSYTIQYLRSKSFITKSGVSMLGISDAAESIGFRTRGYRLTWEQLRDEVPLPCIVHWNQRHFVVVYKIKKRRAQSLLPLRPESNDLQDLRIDLSDVTFVFPLRIDSPERKANIDTLIKYSFRNFGTKFIILEADSKRRYFPETDQEGFRYEFIEDKDEVFHRTKWINRLINLSDTPVVGIRQMNYLKIKSA